MPMSTPFRGSNLQTKIVHVHGKFSGGHEGEFMLCNSQNGEEGMREQCQAECSTRAQGEPDGSMQEPVAGAEPPLGRQAAGSAYS